MNIFEGIKTKIINFKSKMNKKTELLFFGGSLIAFFFGYLYHLINFIESTGVAAFFLGIIGLVPILVFLCFLIINYTTKDKYGSYLILFSLTLIASSIREISLINWLFATTRETGFLYVSALILGSASLVFLGFMLLDAIVNKKISKLVTIESNPLFIYSVFALFLVYIYPIDNGFFPMINGFLFVSLAFLFYYLGRRLSFYIILLFILVERMFSFLMVMLEGSFEASFNNFVSLALSSSLLLLVILHFMFKGGIEDLKGFYANFASSYLDGFTAKGENKNIIDVDEIKEGEKQEEKKQTKKNKEEKEEDIKEEKKENKKEEEVKENNLNKEEKTNKKDS